MSKVKEKLTDFVTSQLKVVSSGRDSGPLEDKTKPTLQTSWNITRADRPCSKEMLQKYILNCCEEWNWRQIVKIRFKIESHKRLKLISNRKLWRGNQVASLLFEFIINTQSMNYTEQEMNPNELLPLLWKNLCEKWDCEPKFTKFEEIAEILITAHHWIASIIFINKDLTWVNSGFRLHVFSTSTYVQVLSIKLYFKQFHMSWFCNYNN